MRIVKLGGGQRRIGDAVVDQENLQKVRDVAVTAFEEPWELADGDVPRSEREPIFEDEGVVAVPGSEDENVYMWVNVEGDVIQIPDRSFLLKILQLI